MTTRAKISRPDRALIAALALTLATAGGCFGAVSAHQTQSAAGDALSAEDLSNAYSGANLSGFAQLATEHRCLTEALYYEARGEGRNGQEAVAEVVFHRLNAGGRYGHSICAVVYKGSSRPGCQFSFTCNGDLKRPREAQAW
jgi:spore germination cell wall hydrolase CwlJ-like protein